MFLSISAEGRIVMLVKRKSSHSQRLALEPILSQCVDQPQNFANRYKRKQENSMSCTRHYFDFDQYRSASRLYPVILSISVREETINYVR